MHLDIFVKLKVYIDRRFEKLYVTLKLSESIEINALILPVISTPCSATFLCYMFISSKVNQNCTNYIMHDCEGRHSVSHHLGKDNRIRNHTWSCWGVCICSHFLFVRHEERTWSLEHSDSILSDSPGMMSSSVGTSKCSSPACMEARARRAAHCGYTDPQRSGLQYGDSFDSLGDSPHSDRWEPGSCG